MTKQELIREVADNTGFRIADCKEIFNMALRIIQESVAAGESVDLKKFGTFERRVMNPKKRYDLRTGNYVMDPVRFTVKFKPSDVFRKQTNS